MLALIICLRSFRVWLSDEALQRQIANIQASGDPVSFADLAGEPVPGAVNAASYLERAEKGLSALFRKLAVVRQSKPFRAGQATQSDMRAIRSVLSNHAETIFEEQLGLSSSTYEDFRDAYAEHAGLLKIFPLAGQLFPAVQAVREAMSRVQAETRCLVCSTPCNAVATRPN